MKMKEDIVNQLREHEEKQECGGGVWWENPAVCEEAAKEIERLRHEVETWKAANVMKANEIAALKSAIDTAMTALEHAPGSVQRHFRKAEQNALTKGLQD